MSISDRFITIASRASAKSWLISVYACAIAVLYPHSEVVVVSAVQKTAGIIMDKIEGLIREYPNLAREVENHYNTSNNRSCVFYNTSTIKVVACKDSARGNRSTLTIGEEFRLMDKEKYDSIVSPFAYARQTPYMEIDYWKKKLHPEEFKEILISSAYHKGLWWYKATADIIKDICRGRNVGFIAFDYLIAIEHNIKTLRMIEEEKRKTDLISFQEEYCNIPWGENSDAYFKLSMFERCRTVRKAFFPQRKDNYNPKKNPYGLKKMDEEVRVVSVDIAVKPGEKNDNTIITCIRCLKTPDGYQREVSYMESHSGENTLIQAKRIKQVFYDFESDYLVLDTANSGTSIFDDLGVVITDDDRGCVYPAWTIMYTDDRSEKEYNDFLNRTIAKNAEEVIYPIQAGAKLNNDIAVAFREKLQKRMISFLIGESEADDYLAGVVPEYHNFTDDTSERAWFLNPYLQTAALINESIGLSMSMLNGFIRLKEAAGAKKDRYSSVSYGNYFISTILDPKIRKDSDDDGLDNIVDYVFW